MLWIHSCFVYTCHFHQSFVSSAYVSRMASTKVGWWTHETLVGNLGPRESIMSPFRRLLYYIRPQLVEN